MKGVFIVLAIIVAVTSAIDEEEYRGHNHHNRPPIQPQPSFLQTNKPSSPFPRPTIAAVLDAVLSTTSSPPAIVAGQTKPAPKSKVTLENHPLLRAIHSTVCYGMPKPRSAAWNNPNQENSVIINDGNRDVTFRAVQEQQVSSSLLPAVPTLSETIQTTTNFFASILPFNPWLSTVVERLPNIKSPAEAKQVFGDVKTRLYRNVFRTATSLMFSGSGGEMGAMGNRALNAEGDAMDKLCAKLTEAEQEAMDFRRISKRGMDDNGRHDPEEVSDGEDDDDDVPTWY